MPIINIHEHDDTTPGAGGPFAPPAGWSGDADAYHALMRERYRDDPMLRQWMVLAVRRRGEIRWRGPWAAEARVIVERLAEHLASRED